jgi:methionyl-tRNA formyltransferase
MKIIFIGSGDFSAPIIESLSKEFDIPLCITRPDKKRGRGKKIQRSIVGETCDNLGIETYSPETINSAESIGKIRNLGVDIAVLASYSEILSAEIISCFKNGIVNVHPSLLPKYRGAEPIRWAIRKGEKETGVSLMMVSEELDRGNILSQKKVEIQPDDDNKSLQSKLIELSINMLADMVKKVSNGFKGVSQPQTKMFYARRMKKSDEAINWEWSAERIARQIRSMSPSPGCYTYFKGIRLKLFEPKVIFSEKSDHKPGEIIQTGEKLYVACELNILIFNSIQREGKRRLPTKEFLLSKFFQTGDILNFS